MTDKSPREKLIELDSFICMREHNPSDENKAKVNQKLNELGLWIAAILEENARLTRQNEELRCDVTSQSAVIDEIQGLMFEDDEVQQ